MVNQCVLFLHFKVRHDSRVFEVKIDVQHYEHGQLSVTISDSKLIIKGQHEMKEDEHGSISRQFHREYDIPEVGYLNHVINISIHLKLI